MVVTVQKLTGFAHARKYPEEQSLPSYNLLRRHIRKTSSLLKSPLPPPDLPVLANKKLLAWVGDEILSCDCAKVSVFDSVVQGGDSVWEGLRVYKGKVFKLENHLDRLFDSTKALAFLNVPTREDVKEAIFRTLIWNGMFDIAHIRLSLTRGKKCFQNRNLLSTTTQRALLWLLLQHILIHQVLLFAYMATETSQSSCILTWLLLLVDHITGHLGDKNFPNRARSSPFFPGMIEG